MFAGPCAQNPLEYCDETSVGFLQAMLEQGHRLAFDWGNDDAREVDFRDESYGGDDVDSTDEVQVVHFSSHGSLDDDGAFRGYLGTVDDACSWTSDRARFGSALAVLLLDACHSLEIGADPVAEWGATFDGLRLVCGFTGAVSDASWTSGRGYEAGARIGAGEPIAAAWLDAGYSAWLGDHPAVMAAGRTGDDAEARLDETTLADLGDPVPHDEIRSFRWAWRSPGAGLP